MSSDLANLAFVIGIAVLLPVAAWLMMRPARRPRIVLAHESAPPAPGEDFKPNTKELLRLTGSGRVYREPADEPYAVHEACVAISNRAYTELGAERHEKDIWPADKALVEAMRRSLQDHADTYAGDDLAYTLVRCGCRTEDVLARLHPWERIAFGWRDKSHTGQHIAEMLRQAGLVQDLPDAAIAEIDGWIRDPFSALDAQWPIVSRLFESNLVQSSLQDIGFEPRHDELFKKLAEAASPPVVLGEISQSTEPEERFKDVTAATYVTARNPDGSLRQAHISEVAPPTPVLSDEGSKWIVEYSYEGTACGFLADCNGSWMDVDAVLRHFDEFMSGLGRPERVYRLGSGRGDDGSWGFFIVAHHEKFPDLARQLGVPLQERRS